MPPAEVLGVPVIDAHCHLDLMDGEVGEQLAAAEQAGVAAVVSIGVDVPTSRWQADVAARWPQVWAAVAIHPNEAGRGAADPAGLAEIARLAELPQVRAVGETGLDYFRTVDRVGQRAQQDSFRAHLAIARQTGKALVVHDRDAHEDVLSLLAEQEPPPVTIFHAFSGDAELAHRCAAAGYYCSFAGNLTFANAPTLREAAAVVPPELLLVETDAPFLTPVPFRGRPNGPHVLPLTVRALAELRGEPVDQLCATLASNARRAFALDPPG